MGKFCRPAGCCCSDGDGAGAGVPPVVVVVVVPLLPPHPLMANVPQASRTSASSDRRLRLRPSTMIGVLSRRTLRARTSCISKKSSCSSESGMRGRKQDRRRVEASALINMRRESYRSFWKQGRCDWFAPAFSICPQQILRTGAARDGIAIQCDGTIACKSPALQVDSGRYRNRG